MNVLRLLTHFVYGPVQVRQTFTKQGLNQIAKAVADSERLHRGEIRVCIESSLSFRQILGGMTARERAIDAFSEFRLWDTEENTGILLFLLLADRSIEIIADRGINHKVEQAQWNEICQMMEAMFARKQFTEGVIQGITAVTALLELHFSAGVADKNELPDEVILK